MKIKILIVAFIASTAFLVSFNPEPVSNKREDLVVYIYANKTIKNPDYTNTAEVFTPIYEVTIPDVKWAQFATDKLQSKLKLYIENEMEKQLTTPLLSCCTNWTLKRSEAEDARDNDISKARSNKKSVFFTGSTFSFSYNWQD